MADRAWFAYQCLPRDDRGEPPDWRVLEREHGLSNGTIYKLIWGITVQPTWDTLEKAATALRVPSEWLRREEGAGPIARWPVPVRPAPPAGAAKRTRNRRKSGKMPAVKLSK